LFFYACETWSLALWKNQRPRVFENLCWRQYLELTMKVGVGRYTETGQNFIMRCFRVCAPRQILVGRSHKGERGGRRNADRASVGECKGRWPLGRRRRRREDNTNPDLTKKWDKVYTRLVSSQRNNHSVSAQCAECSNLLGNSWVWQGLCSMEMLIFDSGQWQVNTTIQALKRINVWCKLYYGVSPLSASTFPPPPTSYFSPLSFFSSPFLRRPFF